jgi:predicted acetyltransferase
MALELRAVRDEEIAAFRDTLYNTFGFDGDVEPTSPDMHRVLVEPGQTWAMFDGTTVAGTAATFNLEISVPGGASLPMAGLTMVTVRPSHRRRGILRQLMQRHLDDARERRFPVSGLWASEATIYGRFGYGLAAFCEVYEIGNAHALRIGHGREETDRGFDDLEWLDEQRARELLPAVYARATAERPGALRRSDVWWRERGPEHLICEHERTGQFRQRGKFTDGLPAGQLEIVELIAVDARAEATLWKFALAVDLFPNVTYWNAPADDPLPWLVDDFRRIKRRRGDNLWLRIEDVPATLERRTYARDGVLRIGVGETTYELAIEGGRAQCSTTKKAADLALDMQALSTLYLGCVNATQLARAERIRGEPRALVLADQMFGTALAPWCAEVF